MGRHPVRVQALNSGVSTLLPVLLGTALASTEPADGLDLLGEGETLGSEHIWARHLRVYDARHLAIIRFHKRVLASFLVPESPLFSEMAPGAGESVSEVRELRTGGPSWIDESSHSSFFYALILKFV